MTFPGDFPGLQEPLSLAQWPAEDPWVRSVTMATNREQQVGHMTGFPPAVYPFAFNSMRSHSPFDLLANSSLFGRFGADLPKEMAALCKSFSSLCNLCVCLTSSHMYHFPFGLWTADTAHAIHFKISHIKLFNVRWKGENTAT